MDPSSFASGSILENRETKTEHITIPIIETRCNKPSFKTKPKRKCIIGSVPLFKSESKSETHDSPTHSKYINNVLT